MKASILQHRSEWPSSAERSSRHHVLEERLFRAALVRERRRADRSNQSVGLLLVVVQESGPVLPGTERAIAEALMAAKAETDVAGWFDGRRTIGLIVPEVLTALPLCAHNLERRVQQELERRLGLRAMKGVSIQFHAHSNRQSETADALPPVDGLLPRKVRSRVVDGLKRTLDLVGSIVLLTILSPVFAVIAALMKWKSPGPVFFRQVRIGQGMKPFTMLKFRTMHVNSGHSLHHEFVTSFIKSGAQAQEAGRNGMFKITNDPRVTTIGRILRKTSLDELPQLWNVVRGDMSLVGPRPPLAYEVEQYQPWHRRRLLEAKPGITGLWQVAGRSRTTFDEMVRLDLRYAKACSLWTDIKILVATPAAVITGKGAA